MDKQENNLEISDMNDQNIQINSEPRNVQLNVDASISDSKNKDKNFVDSQKEKFAQSMVQSASEHVTKSWYEKFLCGMEFLKKYFDVNSQDVSTRLVNSLIPFNSKFYDISEKSPDLYGPFWIYTTLVFLIAAAGSLAKYLNKAPTQNFFQEFVPISAAIIYGIGFGLPLVLTILMKCFGSETSFVSVLCTYGYSFTVFIPTVIICAIPLEILQWILISYAVFSSTSLILVNYWKELSKYMENKRYILLTVIIICQIGLFLVLKFYFFERFQKEVSTKAEN